MLNSKQGFLNLNIQNGHVMTPQKWYPWLFRSFWYLICKGIKNNNGEIRIYHNPSKMTLKKSKVLMHAECIKLTSDVFEQRVPSRASDVLEGAEFCSGKTRPQADDDHSPRFFGWFCLLLTLFELITLSSQSVGTATGFFQCSLSTE